MADYTYDAIIKSVHDGDTVTVDIDLGLDAGLTGQKLRLYGINAPELVTPEGKVALAFIRKFLSPGEWVLVDTIKDKTEKYGRYLAVIRKKLAPAADVKMPVIRADGTVSINELMVLNGQAVSYSGGKR
jgi:endonuclease YncB( thermonuclease family)